MNELIEKIEQFGSNGHRNDMIGASLRRTDMYWLTFYAALHAKSLGNTMEDVASKATIAEAIERIILTPEGAIK